LSGVPPFGEGEAAQIVARALAGNLDVSGFSPPVGEWIAKGLAAREEDRFADALEMKQAWKASVRAARRREKAAWWRRTVVRERT
jgi:hypothetical protein